MVSSLYNDESGIYLINEMPSGYWMWEFHLLYIQLLFYFWWVECCTQMYITVYCIWPNKTAHRHWQHFIDSITEKVGEESVRLSIFSLIDCFESISVPEKFQPHHTRTSSFQRTLSPQGVHIEGLENYGVKYYHLVSTHLSAMFHLDFVLVCRKCPVLYQKSNTKSLYNPSRCSYWAW